MKSEIILKLEELLSHQDVQVVAGGVRSVQKQYEEVFQKELEKARAEFIQEGGKSRDFIYAKSQEDEKIIQLLERYRSLKKEAENKIAEDQKRNLSAKREIVREIIDLTQISTNVGTAIKKLTELQAKWKEIGAVSPHDYKDLQAEYSKAVEGFNYNLSIYRALQEHDLKKNEELKQAVIEKFKRLSENENIKEVEQLIRMYRNEWEEIGPVQNDKWETLKGEFRVVLDGAYARLKDFYRSREEEQEKNLSLKRELSAKAKLIAEAELNTEEEWQKQTDGIIALQNEWKTIGKADHKKSEQAWMEFRSHCDGFFARKKEFYSSLKEKFAKGKEEKMKLIEQAEKLQQSTDWKNTSDKLMQLQNNWKKTGAVSTNDEHRLFGRFRKACNTFFDAKRTHFEAVDAQYEGNLSAKETIIQKLNDFQLSGDTATDKASLRAFNDEWRNAGQVPFKEKQRMNEAFFGKLDELYDKLNLSAEEKARDKFLQKLERLSSGENAEQSLIKEADFLRKQIDEITRSIANYENNLGFFKHAKTKNQIMIDTEEKIATEKKRIEEVKKKIQLVREAIQKIKTPANVSSNPS
jgi:Domain of Unknown Function (DUF349)